MIGEQAFSRKSCCSGYRDAYVVESLGPITQFSQIIASLLCTEILNTNTQTSAVLNGDSLQTMTTERCWRLWVYHGRTDVRWFRTALLACALSSSRIRVNNAELMHTRERNNGVIELWLKLQDYWIMCLNFDSNRSHSLTKIICTLWQLV